jgi:hypothetical protein
MGIKHIFSFEPKNSAFVLFCPINLIRIQAGFAGLSSGNMSLFSGFLMVAKDSLYRSRD